MPDKKIRIYQNRLEPIYPHPLQGDMAQICINREWLPLLQGMLYPLVWKSAIWKGTEAEVQLMHEYVGELLYAIGAGGCMPDCEPICDLRIQNGRLQSKTANGDWEDVGSVKQIINVDSRGMMSIDVDGDGTGDTVVNINSAINQIFGSRDPVTDDDRICRASWQLAAVFCDDFADLMKTAQVGSGLIAQTGQAILDWLVLTFIADDTVELITEGLVQAVFEWLVTQARDPETQRKVSQMLYCSIVDHYPDDLGSVLDDIDLGALEPLFEVDTTPRIVKWLNFAEWAETLHDTLNGDLVPNLIIGLMRCYILQIIEFSGIVQPWESIMNRALTTAEYFDSRDCVDFPCNQWTAIFYFDTDSYSPLWFAYTDAAQTWSTYEAANGWADVTIHEQVGETTLNKLANYIVVDPLAGFNIRNISISYIVNNYQGNDSMPSEPLGVRSYLGGSLQSIGGSASPFTNGNGLFVWTWEGDADVAALVFSFFGGQQYNQTPPNGSFVYRQITLSGTGENPFLG